MSPTVIAFYLFGTAFFFSALAFTYYGFKNARLMRGPLGHQFMAMGAGLFLAAILVGAFDHFLFPGSGLVYIEFLIWVIGLVSIVFGGILRTREIQRVHKISILRALTTMPTAKVYFAGITILLFVSLPFSIFSIFASIRPEPRWFNALNLGLWTISFAAMAIAERQLHLAVRPSAIAVAGATIEEELLLREDILSLRLYSDFASRLFVSALPMVGLWTLRDILAHYAHRHSILRDCEMTDAGVLVIERAVERLTKVSEKDGLHDVLDGYSVLVSRLIDLYSALVSPELAVEMVTRNYRAIKERYRETWILHKLLESVPQGFLEEEKLALLSREELGEKVKERTRELEESLIKAKEVSEALRASNASFHNIVERSTDGVVVVDQMGIVQFANPAVESFFAQGAKDLIGEPFGFPTVAGEIKEIDIVRNGGQQGIAELRIVETEWEEKAAYLALLRDITERKRAEEQIRSSLEEKEMLLKEIHHRVKNNLQVVSSLLYLQSKSTEEHEILAVLQESQHRIRSMALVHEKLYQTQDLIRIDFAEYIESLSNYLVRSYGVSPARVKLTIDVNDVFLDLDTAIPCGLIVNELVSNCLKHAFPDGQAGEIHIELCTTHEGHCTLVVTDNGTGFPQELDLCTMQSLGLRLVNSLVSQLEGIIELDRCEGTRFKIVFAEPVALKKGVAAQSEQEPQSS
jgi:two-component sensor histidine kinase